MVLRRSALSFSVRGSTNDMQRPRVPSLLDVRAVPAQRTRPAGID